MRAKIRTHGPCDPNFSDPTDRKTSATAMRGSHVASTSAAPCFSSTASFSSGIGESLAAGQLARDGIFADAGPLAGAGLHEQLDLPVDELRVPQQLVVVVGAGVAALRLEHD